KRIFNGSDLTGWRELPGSKSEFTVKNGAIHVAGGRGFLETQETFGDFLLQAQVRTNGEHLNSGIFFRTIQGTDDGYEVQIHNGHKDGDRTRPVDQGTGAIFRRQPARRVVSHDGEWTAITLVAAGDHFATWVNGFPVVDWTDTRGPSENPREGRRLEAGHITLQGHDPTTDLDFRELRIAEWKG
ncbi:MAG: 3-keto-disaccharide hydrolase, partial [Planctomycetaceae bacterium]